MIQVAVAGCSGRMGQAVVEAVTAAPDMEVVCGIDPTPAQGSYDIEIPFFCQVFQFH